MSSAPLLEDRAKACPPVAARPYLDRTIGDLARQHAAERPDAVAFSAGGNLTYAALLDKAEALASAMGGMGLRPGDVVCFQLPNWVETAVINLAAALGGFIVNPIVTIYRDAEVRDMLLQAKPKIMFICETYRSFDFAAMIDRLADQLEDFPQVVFVRGERPGGYETLLESGRGEIGDFPQVDPNDPKMLLFTSGTTGRAKGVVHTHNTITRAAQNAILRWSIAPGEGILMPSPVTHISGFSNGLELPLIGGTRTVLMDQWNAAHAVELIDEHGIAGIVAATPFLTELTAAAAAAETRIPTLRFFACGGAPVHASVVYEANRDLGRVCAFRIYGSSEVPFVTLGYFGAENADLAATTDGGIFDYDVRILGDDGAILPLGSEGEIAARGPAMFIGYAGLSNSDDFFTPDGYFLTGDLARQTENGGLVITGRKKDIIVRGGENISAVEIEEVIAGHHAVSDVAVVAMPHERLGEGVCAYVVARTVVEPADLIAHIDGHGLAKQKIPQHFEFVDALPRTASGKVRKDVLRDMAKGLVGNN